MFRRLPRGRAPLRPHLGAVRPPGDHARGAAALRRAHARPRPRDRVAAGWPGAPAGAGARAPARQAAHARQPALARGRRNLLAAVSPDLRVPARAARGRGARIPRGIGGARPLRPLSQHRWKVNSMAGLTLVIGNKNYSSWSMRPWVL